MVKTEEEQNVISRLIKVQRTQRRTCRVSIESKCKWFLRLGGLMLLVACSAVSAAASVLWGS